MDGIMREYIDQLKRKVRIADVLRERGIQPSRSHAGKLVYKCPLHKGDNSPSFYVYEKDSGDDYFCYGCKAGGNVVHLVKSLNNCSGSEAVKSLGEIAGIDVDPYYFQYDIDVYIESPMSADMNVDDILCKSTLSFRKLRQLNAIKNSYDVNLKWQKIDHAYWANDVRAIKESSSWTNGK
jgi:hypothetical protein